MSSFSSGFEEIDAMFFEFGDEFNNAEGSSSVDDTSKLQSQPTPKGSQLLSGDEIYKTILGRRSSYSKGLGWGPKPKSRKSSASSSLTSCSQSRKVEEAKVLIEQQRIEHQKAKRRIEEKRRTSKLHAQQMEENAQQMEQMKKMIEEDD
ncbi:cytochrome P450 CYP82D47-like [Cucumis melo var. makuwa]|uniref:Cytochrome P450 CYP82D47-like n=1 Tax=Cucumis melo var. makuwa TaxID=1194695 RepID=A0A5A7TNG7_CUCMM|nr:cytochrome P450 CYP82D47-like [Cucumis melo var. makuwa]TYK02677.1 cytochrome P450 CYP82D47-like [Cucumis melo var. makuwa]